MTIYSRIGKVKSVNVPKNKQRGRIVRNCGYGFVTFAH